MNTVIETKTCKKCGSDAKVVMGSQPHPTDFTKLLHKGYIARCVVCNNQTARHDTAAEAIAVWNAQ